MTIGTVLAEIMQLKPVFPIQFGGQTFTIYIGLIALSTNIVISFAVSFVLNALNASRGS
jgi:SSS family solute:Na+ symporter